MKNNKCLEVYAFARYVRMSPAKIRRILNQIKGRSCNEALMVLKFMPHKSCLVISKVIISAMSNAKSNLEIVDKESTILISEARVDEGPSLKRFCPHAQGRGFPIKKRMSHIVSLVCN